jgi:nicotinate phosphoribosyltransferase
MIVQNRLRPDVFRLPIEKIRAGYKSDVYFNRTKYILERDNHHVRVTVQVFQKTPDVTVVGIDQALAILYVGTGYYRNRERAEALFARYLDLERQAYRLWLRLGRVDWETFLPLARERFEVSQELDRLWVSCFSDLTIRALYDGERAGPREPVLEIEGDYSTFAHLETLYLGALSAGTRVATNTRLTVEAARGKPILMFGARHEGHEAQVGSGYAAYVAGAVGVSTDEGAEWWGSKGLGTMPHALIAAYGGDTVLATLKFAEYIDAQVHLTALVDFDNDCVNTALAVARALGGRLWGVRLDTAEDMVDRSIWEKIQAGEMAANGRITGVTPELVWLVREALDRAGYHHVRIVASGGFTPQKIAEFERLGVPVDVYGVGSSLLEGSGGKYDYTADIVKVNGRPLAKRGRLYRPNPRLHPVDLQALVAGL